MSNRQNDELGFLCDRGMDIVERLRAEAEFSRRLNMQGFQALADLCTEAAVEIETLRRDYAILLERWKEAEARKPLLNPETALSGRLNQDISLRYCNCADPENCKQAIPGKVCRAGRTIWMEDQ